MCGSSQFGMLSKANLAGEWWEYRRTNPAHPVCYRGDTTNFGGFHMAVVGDKISTGAATGRNPAIKALHVFSSGRGEQHKEHRYGSRMPQFWWVLTSRSWLEVPINYFLIEHRDGPILFDTGLDPEIATDKSYISSAIGRFLLKRIFRLHITGQDRLDKVLDANGFAAGDIRKAVLSHLHFDHVGGIARIPQAKLLVSDREWAQLAEPHPEREWILREHIEIPQADWQPFAIQPSDDPLFGDFEGVYDVASDGSMVLLPTPGHTPGSVSMLIRSDGWPPILLVGDLTYEANLLTQDVTPGTGDEVALRSSYAKVRRLNEKLPDLVIVPSHDFSAAEAIGRVTTG
jgi:N-acyl homoserine lactone hydrolase